MDTGAFGTLKARPACGLPIPIWAVLGAVVLHLLVFGIFGWSWHLPSWLRGPQERLVVKHIRLARDKPVQLSLVPPSQSVLAEATPPQSPLEPKQLTPATPPHITSEPVSQSDNQDEGYLPDDYLSRPATPEHEIDLQDIDPAQVAGRMQLLLWIDSNGEVTQVDIEATDAPGRFTDQVIDRFKQSHFVPGQRDDKPVASLMRIEVSF